jgi:adenine deaminase
MQRSNNMDLTKIVKVARGDAVADLALCNGRLINVYTGEIKRTSSYPKTVSWPKDMATTLERRSIWEDDM